MDENEKKRQERERQYDARQRREASLLKLEVSGAPTRAIAAWKEGLGETPAVQAVRDWLEGDKTFLLLMGGVGCGKTVAATEAVAKLGGAFVSAADVSRLGLYGADSLGMMSRMESTRLLVLDDLGAEYLTDVWKVQLDGVINARYGKRARTLLTSNLTPEVFRERYDIRIADRINHDGVVFRCGATSLRRKE